MVSRVKFIGLISKLMRLSESFEFFSFSLSLSSMRTSFYRYYSGDIILISRLLIYFHSFTSFEKMESIDL